MVYLDQSSESGGCHLESFLQRVYDHSAVQGIIYLPILLSLNLLILLALTIFIYLKTKAESDGYRSIMYRIADKWV